MVDQRSFREECAETISRPWRIRNTPPGVCGVMMPALSSEDYSKVLAAVEILSQAEDYGTLPRRSLMAVMTAIDVDFASYAEVDLTTGWNRFLVLPGIEELPPGSPAYLRYTRRFGYHPILAHQLASAAAGRPDRDSFIDRLRFLGMVGNCCGEADLLLNLDLEVQSSRKRRVGISVNRGIRDFEPSDIERLKALKPHMVAAHRVAVRLEELSPAPRGGEVSGLPLTSRESEVLYWVSMGKTNGEVGEIIGARPMTVKKHLEHIYDKLGVPNRTAAALKAQALA
jgi:DNA-binding CsgD family transcriptional regulator